MDTEADGAHAESDRAAHVSEVRNCYGKKQQNFLSKNILAVYFWGIVWACIGRLLVPDSAWSLGKSYDFYLGAFMRHLRLWCSRMLYRCYFVEKAAFDY